MSVPDDTRQLRADERETAMVLALFHLREQARLYAKLYRMAHPGASDEECYRAPIAAARHSGDVEHPFWGILSARVVKILTQALRREWTQ